jgi:hypothetical protein
LLLLSGLLLSIHTLGHSSVHIWHHVWLILAHESSCTHTGTPV